MRGALTLLMMLSLAGCHIALRESNTTEKNATHAPVPSFCEVTGLMTWAPRDSFETQDEIRAHNAKVRRYCRPGGTPNGQR